MNTQRKTRRAAVALLVALLAAFPVHPDMGPPEDLLMEISPVMVQQARELSEDMLPTAGELGPGWRYAWQLPRTLPGAAVSRDAYWQEAGDEMAFSALDAQQARQVFNAFTAATAAQGDGLSARDAGAMLVGAAKMLRPVDRMKTTLTMARDAMSLLALAEDPEQVEFDPAASMRRINRALIAPFAGMDRQALADAFVHEVTRIQRQTLMTYYRSNNWKAVTEATGEQDIGDAGVWVGKVKVQLLLIDPDRVDEIADVSADETADYQKRLSGLLQSIIGPTRRIAGLIADKQIMEMNEVIESLNRQIAEEKVSERRSQLFSMRDQLQEELTAAEQLARHEKTAIGQARVEVVSREFGANSYVIRLHGVSPDTPGLTVALYTGWVRNGNALAQIELAGNFPVHVMTQEMDHFLAELDARTRAQADDL